MTAAIKEKQLKNNICSKHSQRWVFFEKILMIFEMCWVSRFQERGKRKKILLARYGT